MTGRKLVLACSAGAAVIALALAGMMDIGGGTEGPPPSPASHRTRDAAAVRDDTPLLRQGVTAVAPDTWDERIEPGAEWDGPTLLAKTHFRVRPAGAAEEGDFTCGHPVSLWADGTLVATTDPPGLRLPAKTRYAVFKAVGYRPFALPVPAAAGGSVDFGNVVLEPDAAVRIRLVDAPASDGEIRFVVGKALAIPYAEQTRRLRDGSAEVLMPAPSCEDLQVCAFTVSDLGHNCYFAMGCRTIRLRSEETGVVELRPLPGGRVTVEVRGPSAALLPHLAIALWQRDQRDWFGQTFQCPLASLDGSGRAVFWLPDSRCEIGVRRENGTTLLTACDGSGTAQTTAADALLIVTPLNPLAGILVRNHGQPVSSRLSLRGPDRPPANATRAVCHVCTGPEVQAVREFDFQLEEGGNWHTCLAEDAQTDGDLTWLDVERSPARCSLSVHAELPAEYHSSLGIRAEPLDGGPAIRIGGNRPPFEGRLSSGTYRLRWICSGGAAAVIDDRLELAAGEHREITAFVPVLERWEARIRDQEVLGMVPVGLRIGDVWSEGCALPGRTVPFLMPAPSQPGATADIYLHLLKMTVPGRITCLDQTSHTFTVEHGLTAADRVRIRTRGLGSGRRQICLASHLTDNRIPAWLGDAAEVLVPPGSERTGFLIEQIDPWQQVTCWFTLRHGSGELSVEPRGHWTTVRVQPECNVQVFVDGPAEANIPATGPGSITAGQVQGPGECQVFVADGTRAVRVVRPQGTLTFAPDQVEIVVR
jgi:hypothetical protein